MNKFFIKEEQKKENQIRIIEEDVNHIKQVLRLQVGEEIEVGNLTKEESYRCKITKIERQEVICEVVEELGKTREPNVYLHLFQGLPKAEKLEWIIQKTTEIGISEITPVKMKRCVVKLEEKAEEKKRQRWQKIAEGAAKQSKRDRIPYIGKVIELSKIKPLLEGYDEVFLAYEGETKQSIKEVLKQMQGKEKRKIAIIVGPEGRIRAKRGGRMYEYGGY